MEAANGAKLILCARENYLSIRIRGGGEAVIAVLRTLKVSASTKRTERCTLLQSDEMTGKPNLFLCLANARVLNKPIAGWIFRGGSDQPITAMEVRNNLCK
jgi:hypothetical protein